MDSFVNSRIDDIIKRFAELVMQEFSVSSMYLFGSYAKGNYSEDSDIDIAVIGNNFVGDPIEDTLKLMRIRRKVDNRIEPHPFNSSDFDLTNPFVREIVSTGRKIM